MPRRVVLLASLAVTLVVITWTLARATEKHDIWIQGRLGEEFTEDAKFDKVQPVVRGGVVSLKGAVPLFEDKWLAGRKARAVDHVRKVKNEIIVKTPWVPDGVLRMQLKRNLRNHEVDGVGLKVRSGVVTVRGTVPANRERVLSLIASTEGVRAIRDRTTLVE
jgi:osmotically-inducible protein OsmY